MESGNVRCCRQHLGALRMWVPESGAGAGTISYYRYAGFDMGRRLGDAILARASDYRPFPREHEAGGADYALAL
jgi:hypothetical protein